MKIPNAKEPLIEYNAIRGSFGKRVKYFMTKTNLRDVAENLALAPQGSLLFQERIQRLVNRRRVDEEILPYLERDELRFFNSLVCILLPDSESTGGYWEFEEYVGDNGESLGGLGKLKITKSVGRVVLDGQHRYEALKEYWHKYQNDLFERKGAEQMDVAIVFICIDDIGKTGTPQKNPRSETIAAVRNLFAVLNKTARKVDKSTLLLIDDSDILNVFTRKIIEEGLLAEEYIKWTAGQNLGEMDPYFTSLHVVRDAIEFLLRDYEQVAIDFGEASERDRALRDYYYSAPHAEMPVCDIIKYLFNESFPFLTWKKLLEQKSVKLKLQPERTQLTKVQAKAVKDTRKNSLLYTVAGQKAVYRAVIEVFLQLPRKNLETLALVQRRLGKLASDGCFSRIRSQEKKVVFAELLIDGRGNMINAERPVDCARQIIAVGLGSGAARQPILERYEALTDNPPSFVEGFWARASELLKDDTVSRKTVRK